MLSSSAIGFHQPQPLTPLSRAAAASAASSQTSAATAAEDDAVSVQITSAAPPDDVLAAISAASDAYDQLAAAGRHVSFGSDPASGALQIQLQDQNGTVLSRLSPSQVLELADGKALENPTG